MQRLPFNAHGRPFGLITLLVLLMASPAFAQGTSFTYQGKLSDGGSPATGQYDFQFSLFDTADLGTGTQFGTTQMLTGVAVGNGVFTVHLDFGACPTCFNGAPRYLEIAVKPTSSGTFTTLGPRQPLSSTPYAIRSLNAAAADGLSVACVTCVTSGQIGSVSGSAVTGTIPVASVPPESASYIQNATSQQAASNFNVSGTGTAGVFNAATQFDIGGSHVLSAAGSGNLFAGRNAGTNNTSGITNAFFGANSGAANSTGSFNSFFGAAAGAGNSTGGSNAFFGIFAGFNNTTGSSNSFFGRYSGLANTTGSYTTIFGSDAGLSNSTENENTFIGASSNGAAGISNATAIGSRAAVSQSNSLVLGSISGVNGATASVNVGIGTTAPTSRLHVVGDINTTTQYTIGGSRVLSAAGYSNLFAGMNAGAANTTGNSNSFFGAYAGMSNTTSFSNSFFGKGAGQNNTTGNSNSFFGAYAGLSNTAEYGNTFIGVYADVQAGITNATAIGYQAKVTQSNSLVLGSINGVNGATANTRVGIGTTSPAARLHVVGDTVNVVAVRGESSSGYGVYGSSASGYGVYGSSSTGWAGAFTGKVNVTGTLTVGTLGSGGLTTLCKDLSGLITTCSSSLRYKTDVRPFAAGLDTLSRLRPITFTWKQGGSRDLGLAAEEVEQVEPLLVTYNAAGQVEGVKYDRINVLLINAVKQQQTQIDQQRQQLTQQSAQIKQQQAQIEALQRLICQAVPTADLCKP